MKKVFVFALVIIGTVSFAQNKGEKRENLSPEQQTELLIKKMTLELDLDVKQQNAIKPILLEEVKERENLKEERISRKEKDEKVSKEERFETRKKMLDKQIAIKEKMKGILTPNQMEKWETIKTDKQEKMKKNRKMKSKE